MVEVSIEQCYYDDGVVETDSTRQRDQGDA